MSNAVTKKGLVLASLLLITLFLVWKAPAPEAEKSHIVQAVRSISERADVRVKTSSVQDESSPLVVKPRQLVMSDVDLFDSPSDSYEVIKQPVVREVITPQVKTVRVPFKYIGMLEQNKSMTLFLMSGSQLYLVKQGDVVEHNFKLVSVDQQNKQLEWLHLPSNQSYKTSMEK